MRDLRYEQFLNKSGVPWHYEEKIALSQVNEVESFKNQARYQLSMMMWSQNMQLNAG